MNVWSLLNVALLGLSVWTGYSEMAPEKLAHSNPDVIFCTVTLVGTIAFSFAAVWYSISGLGSKRYVVRRGVVFLSTGGMTRCSAFFFPVVSPELWLWEPRSAFPAVQ